MGKSTPSAPAAPDPAKTSAAQTQSNKETALYTFGLNNPNVNTPLGSSSYSVSNTTPTYDNAAYDKAMAAWQAGGGSNGGSNAISYAVGSQKGQAILASGGHIGPDGRVMAANGGGSAGAAPKLSDFAVGSSGNPSVTQNITLSPDQQRLYDQNIQQSIGLSNLATQLQGRVGDTLNQPTPGSADFATAEKNAQDAYYKNQTQYLDPQWNQSKTALDSQLQNQGIMAGSDAYNQAENNFSLQKQSAYDTAQNNAILQGPQNAQQLFALSTAARNQPLTEFNALRTGAQPQMPTFNANQPTNVAPTNVLGAYNTAYQGNLNSYNQQVAGQNSFTGDLFGLGGALGAAGVMKYSDIRLKENIHYLGQEKGIPVYSFNYIADPAKIPYRGVMAQEIMSIMPQAISYDGEYMMVNYGMLGVNFGRIH